MKVFVGLRAKTWAYLIVRIKKLKEQKKCNKKSTYA